MAELENASDQTGQYVRSAAKAPVAEDHQPADRPEGGARRCGVQHLGCRAHGQDRRSVRGQLEEISPNQNWHTRPLHAAEAAVTLEAAISLGDTGDHMPDVR